MSVAVLRTSYLVDLRNKSQSALLSRLSFGLLLCTCVPGHAVWFKTGLLAKRLLLFKELQDTQIRKTLQQNAALTLLDGAPATML
jgi:hypothetical protein